MLSFEQCFILFCSFPLLFAFVVGGLGFEFCEFVAGWRHALRSEWPFIIIIRSGREPESLGLAAGRLAGQVCTHIHIRWCVPVIQTSYGILGCVCHSGWCAGRRWTTEGVAVTGQRCTMVVEGRIN